MDIICYAINYLDTNNRIGEIRGESFTDCLEQLEKISVKYYAEGYVVNFSGTEVFVNRDEYLRLKSEENYYE